MTTPSPSVSSAGSEVAAKQEDVLLLTDRLGSNMWADLDVLLPGRVAERDFTAAEHGRDILGPFAYVITAVTNGANVQKLNGNLLCGSVRYGKRYPERLSYDRFVGEMRALATRYPHLRLQEEGEASDGRMMYSLNLGDASKPTVYLGAVLHGWEWENAFGLLRFVELLCRIRALRACPRTCWRSRWCPSRTLGATNTSPARTRAEWT
ncbi:MAG: hypothetical protein ACYC5O_01535 [Anaerolineae bacterium]